MTEVQFESILACGQGEHIELRSQRPSTLPPELGVLPQQPARRPSHSTNTTESIPDFADTPAKLPSSSASTFLYVPTGEQPAITLPLFSPSFSFQGPPTTSTQEIPYESVMSTQEIPFTTMQHSQDEHVFGTLRSDQKPEKIRQTEAMPNTSGERRQSTLPSLLDRASKEVTLKVHHSSRLMRPLMTHRSTAPEGYTLQRFE